MQKPLVNAPRPVSFAVLRVPFFLEPEYDESKPFIESNRERLVKKWGGMDGWNQQKDRHNLKGRGEEAGIPHFNLDRLAANSMASHRLIQYLGKTYGLHISEAIYDKLNEYYFVDGHSLNDQPRLAETVAEALEKLWINEENKKSGQNNKINNSSSRLLPPPPTAEELLDFLKGDEGRSEINAAIQALYGLGISGIPKFIIEGRSIVDGAAHSDVFVHIFREIEERGEIANGPIFGDILGLSPEMIQRGSHHRSDGLLENVA